MNITKITTITAALSAAMLIGNPRGMAQDATPAPAPSVAPSPAAAPSASPSTDGRRGNMEEFRQRINDRIKTALKATDDEWAVIQPLLEKVQTLQRTSMAGRFSALGGFGRRGGNGGGGDQGGGATPAASGSPASDGNGGNGNGNNRPDRNQPSPETQALKTALDSDATLTPADIKAKLQALRDSRKKSSADLDAAREDLKKVLTLRQEATLVMMGFLD